VVEVVVTERLVDYRFLVSTKVSTICSQLPCILGRCSE